MSTHLASTLAAARLTLALAERRRVRDVAGSPVGAKAAQVARLRARVARLEALVAAEEGA